MPGEQGATLIGREVAHYRITELIGRGGMGEVYLADDLKLHRPVAMKRVLSERLTADGRARHDLMREARIASKLVHPYIASVYDVVELDGDPLIVMEHLRGNTLNRLIRSGALTPEKVRKLGIEIAEALAAIHDAGLVHRDLKPPNVMVTPDGHAKVMDFGLTGRNAASLPTVDGESPTVTVSEQVARKGTPQYMAPEQIRGFRADHRSDLFSLGVLIFEALTGAHPFSRNTLADTLASILNDPPTGDDRVLSLTRDNPVGAIAMKLLEKDPEQRYQSATEVVEQLSAASADMGRIAERHAFGIRSIGPVLLVAVVVIGGMLLMRDTRRAPPQLPGRPAVAILPLDDMTEDSDDRSSRGPMIAGLMTAGMSASASVRPVSQERIRELSPPDDLSARLARLREALPVRWVVTGRLFDDDGTLVATFDVHDVYSGGTETFSASKPKATHLAREAASILVRTLDSEQSPPEGGSFPVVSDSDEAQALYTRARQLERDMRYAQALELTERAIVIDTAFVEARLLLAELHERLGSESRAIREARTAGTQARSLGIAGESTTGLRISARVAELTADRAAAEDAYKLLVERFPDDPEYLSALARIKRAVSLYAEAAALYEDALLYDPLDPDLHLSRAGALTLAGEIDEARDAIVEAKRLCGLFGIRGCAGRAAETEGRMLWAGGNFAQSAESYGRAAEGFAEEGLTTRALLPLKSQADIELRLWRLETGVQRLSRVVERAREDGYVSLLVRALNSLGAGQYRMRDLRSATVTLREAVGLSARLDHRAWESSAQLNLANVLLLGGEVDAAAAAVARSLELARGIGSKSREASSLLRQADVQRQRGDDGAARTTLDLILDTDLPGKTGAQFRCSAQQRLVWIELDSENTTAALAAAEAAVREAETLEIQATSGYSLSLRAIARSRAGEEATAAADLASAEERFRGLDQAPALADAANLAHAWHAASRGDWAAVLELRSSGRPTTEGARLDLLRGRAEAELGLRSAAASRLGALSVASHAPASVAKAARLLLAEVSSD